MHGFKVIFRGWQGYLNKVFMDTAVILIILTVSPYNNHSQIILDTST